MSDTDTQMRLFNASKIKSLIDTGQSMPDIVHKIMDELPDLELNIKTSARISLIEIKTLDLLVQIHQNTAKVICQKTKRVLAAKEFLKK